MSKRLSVACDTPSGVRCCELVLPDDASVEAAVCAARLRLADAAVDWQHAVTGIYGRVCSRGHIPLEGDRIELYRGLKLDARARRRQRLAAAARAARR